MSRGAAVLPLASLPAKPAEAIKVVSWNVLHTWAPDSPGAF